MEEETDSEEDVAMVKQMCRYNSHYMQCDCCATIYNLVEYYNNFWCLDPDEFHIFCIDCFIPYDGATCPIHSNSFYND